MLLTELNTPCYIIRAGAYEQNMARFRAAFASRWGEKLLLGYSVKTNNFPWLLKTAMERGFWAEVVSPDEYDFALRCGCPEAEILFNGPQKQDRLLTACWAGATVNLDNLEEVEAVCAAFGGGDFAPRLGLRVNFDLEALCPGETTCQGVPGRFGLCLENGDFARALEKLQKAGLPLAGLHLHQSSKSRSLNIFAAIADFENGLRPDPHHPGAGAGRRDPGDEHGLSLLGAEHPPGPRAAHRHPGREPAAHQPHDEPAPHALYHAQPRRGVGRRADRRRQHLHGAGPLLATGHAQPG